MNILTPTIINKYLKSKFNEDENLREIYLEAEVSTLSISNNHAYFTLKDETSEIKAVMFSSNYFKYKEILKEGIKIIAFGSISIYEPRGTYSINVLNIKEKGAGKSYLDFIFLRDKLEKEGLFDQARKQKIPRFPSIIGVVTSSTGDAINDILTTINKRFPVVNVKIYNALVQGTGSAESLKKALTRAISEKVSTIIIGRGGGSYEDLVSFNDEGLARLIASSPIPIISGIGHENDFTIADFVCDVRGATPTAAAQIATPDQKEILNVISSLHKECKSLTLRAINEKNLIFHEALKSGVFLKIKHKVLTLEEKVKNFYQKLLFLSPISKINNTKKRLTEIEKNFAFLVGEKIKLSREKLKFLTEKLELVNPDNILERGYTLVYQNDKLIKRARVFTDAETTIKFFDGDRKVGK